PASSSARCSAGHDAGETSPDDAGTVADPRGHRRARDTDHGRLLLRVSAGVELNKVVARWSIGNLNDPVVLVAVSLVLFVVTMMSAAIRANRAASIQPADALRID